MEAVTHANKLWLTVVSDAFSPRPGFRIKEQQLWGHNRVLNLMQGLGRGGAGGGGGAVARAGAEAGASCLLTVTFSFPASSTGGASAAAPCASPAKVALGMRYSPAGLSQSRMMRHSLSNSGSDFSSVTDEASSPYLSASPSPLSVPGTTPGAAGSPINVAPAGGLLHVAPDVEGSSGPQLLSGELPSASGSIKFSLDSALQQSQDNAGQLDVDLQGILSNIHTIQIQNEVMSKQMKDFQELLLETTKSLNSKAQEARIEAVKLKKLAIMQKMEEVKRSEGQVRKSSSDLIQELHRTTDSSSGSEDDAACEVEDQASGEIADIANYLKESRSSDDGWNTNSNALQESSSESDQSERSETSEQATDDEMDVSSMTNLSESMECVVAHPGALSCTKTVIKKDDSRKTAVVTMETSVRCTGDGCLITGLDSDDYVALAMQTLVETAQAARHSRIQQSRLSADPVCAERHARIVDILAHGKIVGSRPMEPPSKFGHESFIVQLQEERTGEKMEALFKPRAYGDAEGWHRAPVEWVAYELNLLLGMDYVPPVAYRRGRIELKCAKHFQEGAFVYYVRNSKELKRVPATHWGVPVARLLSDTRILDCLLNNSDRHHGHFLFGEHWADRFKSLPVLIDHAAGFRKEAVVSLTDENAFQTGPVRCVSAKTYLRLRFLEKQEVAEKFKGFLSQDEVEQLMKRRDGILAYLDRLVAERGYQRTVIEM